MYNTRGMGAKTITNTTVLLERIKDTALENEMSYGTFLKDRIGLTASTPYLWLKKDNPKISLETYKKLKEHIDLSGVIE